MQAGQSLQEQRHQEQDQASEKAGLLDLGCGIRCRHLVMVRAQMSGVPTIERMGMRVGVVLAVRVISPEMEMRREQLHQQQREHDADDDTAGILFPESHERV